MTLLNVWEDKPPRNKRHLAVGVRRKVVKHKGCRASLTLLNVWEDNPPRVGRKVGKHKGCRASLTLLNVWEDKPPNK